MENNCYGITKKKSKTGDDGVARMPSTTATTISSMNTAEEGKESSGISKREEDKHAKAQPAQNRGNTLMTVEELQQLGILNAEERNMKMKTTED